jgi:uncharacterized protein
MHTYRRRATRMHPLRKAVWNQTNEYSFALKEARKSRGDLRKAQRLLLEAHKRGDPRATYALATWFLFGKGNLVVKDVRKGVNLLRVAARFDEPNALHDLAVCYETGAGARRSEKMAFALYLRAALAGDPQSAYEVGRCYWYGIGSERNRRIANIWLDYSDQQKVKTS